MKCGDCKFWDKHVPAKSRDMGICSVHGAGMPISNYCDKWQSEMALNCEECNYFNQLSNVCTVDNKDIMFPMEYSCTDFQSRKIEDRRPF